MLYRGLIQAELKDPKTQVLYDDFVKAHKITESNNGLSVPIGLIYAEGNYLSATELDANSKLKIQNKKNTANYGTLEILAASVFDENLNSGNVTFVLNKERIVGNKQTDLKSLEADFGDGKGFRKIALPLASVSVVYTAAGLKVIKFRIETKTKTIASESKVNIQNLSIVKPTFTFDISVPKLKTDPAASIAARALGSNAGAQVAVYTGCDGVFDKPVIIVEGFDPDNSFSINALNSNNYQFGEYSVFYSLWQKGYDRVFINFNDATDYIQNNAEIVRQVILEINRIKLGNTKNIVIGESMGGVVARYALKTIENQGGNHDTSHYISFDAPHKGANVPVGFQTIGNDIADINLVNWFNLDLGALNSIVASGNSPAAKQMLLRYKSPNPDLMFTQFQQELQTLGYPNQSRNIAITNGSGTGIGQSPLGSFNPNDIIFQLDASIGIASVFSKVRTNTVNGSNTVSSIWLLVGALPTTIKEKAFSFNNINYDICPGGVFFDTPSYISNQIQGFSDYARIFPISYFNWTNYNRPSHSFVPTFSAIDYTGAINTQSDLFVNTSTALATGKTPFSAIYASTNNSRHIYTSSYSAFEDYNRGNYATWSILLNTEFPSGNCTPTATPPAPATPFFSMTAQGGLCYGNRGFPFNVFSGVDNGYISKYQYTWQVSSSNGYTYTTTGRSATLFFPYIGTYTIKCTAKDILNSPFPSSSISNTYTVSQPCPSSFRLGVEENESTNLQLLPNPMANQTTISFNLAEADDVSLKIYNETGQEVAIIFETKHLAQGQHSYPITLNQNDGVYLCRLVGSKVSEVKKFIINQ